MFQGAAAGFVVPGHGPCKARFPIGRSPLAGSAARDPAASCSPLVWRPGFDFNAANAALSTNNPALGISAFVAALAIPQTASAAAHPRPVNPTRLTHPPASRHALPAPCPMTMVLGARNWPGNC